jgi:branched-subunit amino acid aminotransferase/4-amino-4-deoxychorismate lyase
MLVWLNGEFVDREQATVSIFDAGYQHAVGLFETMAARHGRVFRLRQHIDRLIDSTRELLLTQRLVAEPLIEAVQRTVARNNMDTARVRLSVTGGDLGRPASEQAHGVDPTIVIVAQPATVYPDAFFEDGVTVTIADGRLNPLDPMAGHKTMNYWPRVRALQLAAARQAGETLWFSVSNHLTSGSVSNVFIIKDDTLLTPIARGEEVSGALRAPVLPGITRHVVLELAEELGMDAARRMLDIEELLAAEEVFLTNSSWGILPVVQVEREAVGDGQVGDRTRLLRQHWLDRVEQETASHLPDEVE